MKCNNSNPKARDAKRRVSVVATAPSCVPEESPFQVEKPEKNHKIPNDKVASSLNSAWKARKDVINKGDCGQYSSDESSECDEEPAAHGIDGLKAENDPLEEFQPTINESNLVDADVNGRAMLVEADLAPELTSAEEVNIHEEEEMIVQKKQYKRVLFFAMVFYGLAIIGCITSFVLLVVNPPPAFGKLYNPLWNGLLEAGIFLFIATMVILIPTRRCCRSSIRLEEYAPDDKQLLRDAQIASIVSFILFYFVAIPIITSLPNFQWLGYSFMAWFSALNVFAFSRVRLLRRSKETRKKTPMFVWVLFVLFFIGLTGITIWRCLNPVYPNCTVPKASWIGDGVCDREPYVSEECGYDGGDCIKLLDKYPDCFVEQPLRIADGTCDGGPYNTMECGYDGGDCAHENEGYPNCIVPNPSWIGDGNCDGLVYGTVECGFDGGDCLEPGERCGRNRDCASQICNSVTKVCDSAHVSDRYPNCSVGMPDWVGDGECDGGIYASEACGFDGGDCLELGKACLQDEECASGFCNADTKVCYLGVLESYPDCFVEDPWKIGDGECDGGAYATKVCGYDGGDCFKPLSISGSPKVFPTFHLAALEIFLSSKLFF